MRASRATRTLVATGLGIALCASAASAASGTDARRAPHRCETSVADAPRTGFSYDPAGTSERAIAAADAALRAALRSAPAGKAAARVVIDVYAHVLRSQSSGGVPQHRIERQIDVLNGAFAGQQSRSA